MSRDPHRYVHKILIKQPLFRTFAQFRSFRGVGVDPDLDSMRTGTEHRNAVVADI